MSAGDDEHVSQLEGRPKQFKPLMRLLGLPGGRRFRQIAPKAGEACSA